MKGILDNNRLAYYINIIIVQYKVMQVNSAQIHRHSPLLFSIRHERGNLAHQYTHLTNDKSFEGCRARSMCCSINYCFDTLLLIVDTYKIYETDWWPLVQYHMMK